MIVIRLSIDKRVPEASIKQITSSKPITYKVFDSEKGITYALYHMAILVTSPSIHAIMPEASYLLRGYPGGRLISVGMQDP